MRNRKFSKWIFIFLVILSMGCTPNQEQIVSIVQQTLVTLPTQTPYPTYTPFPTSTPVPKNTPTIKVDIEATLSAVETKKEYFSNGTKQLLGDRLGCVIADWKESSFELVCVDVVGTDTVEELVEVAYTITSGLGNRMNEMEMDFCFEEDFSFVVTLLTHDMSTGVRTVTPGNVIKMLVDKVLTTQSEWETLSVVELKENLNDD